jgi:hypothetical protein
LVALKVQENNIRCFRIIINKLASTLCRTIIILRHKVLFFLLANTDQLLYKPRRNMKCFSFRNVIIGIVVVLVGLYMIGRLSPKTPNTSAPSEIKPTITQKTVSLKRPLNKINNVSLSPKLSISSGQPILIGYGATKKVWNQNHVEDKSRAPDSAYDRQPNGEDEYGGAIWENNRLISISIQLQTSVPNNQAKSMALQLIPSMATLTYDKKLAGCEVEQYYYPELSTLLNDKQAGYINLEYWDDKSPDVYTPSQTNTVDFVPGSSGDESSVGC